LRPDWFSQNPVQNHVRKIGPVLLRKSSTRASSVARKLPISRTGARKTASIGARKQSSKKTRIVCGRLKRVNS